MPDLTLSFVNPRLLDDVSFHPCVRFKRWEVSCSITVCSQLHVFHWLRQATGFDLL